MRRVRAGFCEVRNPMNPSQLARISLRPEDAAALSEKAAADERSTCSNLTAQAGLASGPA